MNALREALSRPGARTLWSGCVIGAARGAATALEHRNMSDGRREASAFLLDGEGAPLADPRRWSLSPGDFLAEDLGAWAREAGAAAKVRQAVMLFEDEAAEGPRVPPAVTVTWSAGAGRCQTASQGFGRLNAGPRGGADYFMFCPVDLAGGVDTRVTVFNHSTDGTYADAVEMTPALLSGGGERREGPPVRIAPFGALVLSVREHFGPEAVAGFEGRGALTMSHPGRIFPSFFHVVDADGFVLRGQHTQPPANALRTPGVWWGRLRYFLP